MREVRASWPGWRQASPDLPDVELADLPHWMTGVGPPQRDAVLTALLGIADEDPQAYLALAWMPIPGAARVAGRIRRLADEIDEIVAGQLWIQLCAHDPTDSTSVAKKILDRVHRESMAELGVGALAKSRDEAWAMSVVVDACDPDMPADMGVRNADAASYSTTCSRARSTRAR